MNVTVYGDFNSLLSYLARRGMLARLYAAFAEVRKAGGHSCPCVVSGPFGLKLDGTGRGAPVHGQGLLRAGQFDDPADCRRGRDQAHVPAAQQRQPADLRDTLTLIRA